MAKIIQFPKSKPSALAAEAIELEAKKITLEQNLNLMMLSDLWDKCEITNEEIEMLSDFGEVMKFKPLAAARLVSKISEKYSVLVKLIKMNEQNYDDDPWT